MNQQRESQLHHVRPCGSSVGGRFALPDLLSDPQDQKFPSRPPTTPDYWNLAGAQSGEPHCRPREGDVQMKISQLVNTSTFTEMLISVHCYI